METPIIPDDAPDSTPSQRTMPGRKTPRGERLRAGDVLLGRYTVLSELGEGGMGVVYKCFDSVGGIEVALKCLPPELSRNEAEMEGIRENYGIVAKLHHSAISGLRQLEKDPDFDEYYLVMDLAEGEDLSQVLRHRRGAPMPLAEALAILRPLASALDYAHGEKVLHRDVKPANVKVRSAAPGGAPRVQLLDFGLAAEVRSSLSRVSRKGYLGSSGTPAYMAPEQWEARRQGPATDQYALAVVAYQMLAGVRPFDADDPDVLRRAVLSRDPDPIPGLPRWVNAALRRALAKDPATRFPSCTAFVEALEKGGGGVVRPGRLAAAVVALAALGTLGAVLLSPRGGGFHAESAEVAKIESHAESAENAVVESHAESAEVAKIESHAESAEVAKIESHAESAENAEAESHAESAENAVFESHAESAESAEAESHAEGAEGGSRTESSEFVSHAEIAEGAEPSGGASRPGEPPSPLSSESPSFPPVPVLPSEGASLEDLEAARVRIVEALGALRAEGKADDSPEMEALSERIGTLGERIAAALQNIAEAERKMIAKDNEDFENRLWSFIDLVCRKRRLKSGGLGPKHPQMLAIQQAIDAARAATEKQWMLIASGNRRSSLQSSLLHLVKKLEQRESGLLDQISDKEKAGFGKNHPEVKVLCDELALVRRAKAFLETETAGSGPNGTDEPGRPEKDFERLMEKLDPDTADSRGRADTSAGKRVVITPGVKGKVREVNREFSFVIVELTREAKAEVMPEGEFQPVELMVRRKGADDEDVIVTRIRLINPPSDEGLTIGENMYGWEQLPVEPGDSVVY